MQREEKYLNVWRMTHRKFAKPGPFMEYKIVRLKVQIAAAKASSFYEYCMTNAWHLNKWKMKEKKVDRLCDSTTRKEAIG